MMETLRRMDGSATYLMTEIDQRVFLATDVNGGNSRIRDCCCFNVSDSSSRIEYRTFFEKFRLKLCEMAEL